MRDIQNYLPNYVRRVPWSPFKIVYFGSIDPKNLDKENHKKTLFDRNKKKGMQKLYKKLYPMNKRI